MTKIVIIIIGNEVGNEPDKPEVSRLVNMVDYLENRKDEMTLEKAKEIYDSVKEMTGEESYPDQVMDALDQCIDEEGRQHIKQLFWDAVKSGKSEADQVATFIAGASAFHDTEPHRFRHSPKCDHGKSEIHDAELKPVMDSYSEKVKNVIRGDKAA